MGDRQARHRRREKPRGGDTGAGADVAYPIRELDRPGARVLHDKFWFAAADERRIRAKPSRVRWRLGRIEGHHARPLADRHARSGAGMERPSPVQGACRHTVDIIEFRR